MKQFVVGFLDLFENDLQLEKVEAIDELDALKRCSFLKGYEFPEKTNIEEIQSEIFNCDSVVSVIEV